MPELLYLDTARVGQISPSAHRALTDYFRLNADQRFPLYFDEFFRDEAEIPDSVLSEYGGVQCWRGFDALKKQVRRLLSASANSDVWFSGRSINLIKIASELMFRRCRNVLITDTTWPSYEKILRQSIPNSSCRITKIEIINRIEKGMSPEELVDFLVAKYLETRCDGLFCPLVSNLGVRLPIRKLTEQIRQMAHIRFVAIDIAQAVNHVSIEADRNYFDIAIGGTHKWARSFLPLGLAISGNPRSRNLVWSTFRRWIEKDMIDDPLFALVHGVRSERQVKFGETVNATPLIASSGALFDALSENVSSSPIETQTMVSDRFDKIFSSCGLSRGKSHRGFQSRILTYTSESKNRHKAVSRVHKRLNQLGVATSLIGDRLRISIPPFGLSDKQLKHMATVNT